MQEGKVCKQCNEFKSFTDYYKSGKYYKPRCKECIKHNQKTYRENNEEKIKEYNKKTYALNREAEKLRRRQSYQRHKETAITYNKYYRRKNGVKEKFIWTKDLYLEKLKEFVDTNDNLNATYVCKYHHSIYKQSYVFFGGWKQALESLGINYAEVQIDFESGRSMGAEFENLVDDILLDLSVDYEKGFSKEIRPDYVFSKDIWGDAKLSEWSINHHNCETLKKYEPKCKMLTIIYMRGNHDRDDMITNKTRLISVHKLIKQLPRYKQRYYQERINEIEAIIS